MAPRANWKGYLRLSLVSCPIALYPASSLSEKVSFNRINRKTGNRLKQQNVDSETGEVVSRDDMVRGYVEGELKALGYRVVTTPSAPAALEILRGPEKIQLLFTDVVMPGGMFGTELAKEAARLRPDLKILLTSGHTEHPVDAIDGGGREVRILNKPYRRHDLAATLRSVLKTG